MKRHSLRVGQVGLRAFSLVEITIAIGVLAFSLTAIMGLLSVSLQSSREATSDTLVAEMSTNLLNTIRKQTQAIDPSALRVFFDGSGRQINSLQDGVLQTMDPAAAMAEDAIYDCSVAVEPDPGTVSADGTPNLWRITLKFRWPVGSSAAANQQTIHADVARY